MSRVTVTEFTDPFSSWCWGAEPIRRRLKEVYRDQLRFEYVMGGLAEDLDDFRNPAGGSLADEGLAAHLQIAAHRHGMPVDVSGWRENPPNSTYPANVAYEAAALQERDRAHAYLRRMREAGLAEGRNLERESVLVELAEEVGLDVQRFRTDLDSEKAQAAFGEDLGRTREHGITGLPAFLIEFENETELVRGYRPFATFEKLFTESELGLESSNPRPVPELVTHYGRVATREVAEIHGLSVEDARMELRRLEETGEVRAVTAGTGLLWESK